MVLALTKQSGLALCGIGQLEGAVEISPKQSWFATMVRA